MSTLEEPARRRLFVTLVAVILCLVQIATLLSGKISLGEQSVFYDMEGDVIEFLRRQYPGRLGYAQDLYEFFDGSDNVTLVVDDAVFRIERDTTPTAWMELSPTLIAAFGGVSRIIFCEGLTETDLIHMSPSGVPQRIGQISDLYAHPSGSENNTYLLRRPKESDNSNAVIVLVEPDLLPTRCSKQDHLGR